VLRLVLTGEVDVTGGPNGLALPPLLATTSRVPYYYLALGLLAGSLYLLHRLSRSRFGLFLHALREDETAAAAMGVDTLRSRVAVFVVTAGLAGLTGAAYGHYIQLVTPGLASLDQMSLVIAMAVLGGVESLVGAAVGAVLVQLGLELLQPIGEWRMAAFGLLLVLTLRFAGDGLVVTAARRLARLRLPAATPAPVPEPPA
jgi:branched-chain amino acid transport system permease protein